MNPLDLPKLTKYINDFSGILSSENIESLSQDFINHENNTTEQVVTVFIRHREGNELLDIGLKVFNENGIGQKNLNNGLLLIVSTEEKKLRIIVGKGMELKYTEMACRNIIENHLRPLLNEGKYIEMIEEWGKIIKEERKAIIQANLMPNIFDKYPILKVNQDKIFPGLVVFYIIAILLATIFPVIGNILIWIPATILGFGAIYGGVYFFRNNQTETKGTRIVASIIICGLGGFFSYFGSQTIYCQFSTSPTCIEWNSPSSFWNNNGGSYENGGSSSYDGSDYDSSSSFDGGGGSSNGGGYGD